MKEKGLKVILIALAALALIGLACSTLTGGFDELPLVSTNAPYTPTQPPPTPEPIDPYWLTLEEMPVYGGIFDDQHCDHICAMGFRPYEATLEDFWQFYEAYPELDCYRPNYPYTHTHCISDTWRFDLDFDPYTEIVDYVTIRINDFTLGEFIQAFGEPTHYFMWVDEQYSQAWPIQLFIPDVDVILWMNDTYDFSELSKEPGYRFESDSALDKVVIYPVDEFCKEGLEDMVPWQGYGIYFTDGKATIDF